MKRLLIISGCLLLLAGLFYDFLPIELVTGAMFRTDAHAYYRVVKTDQADFTQIALLGFGTLVVVAGLLRRPSNRPANK